MVAMYVLPLTAVPHHFGHEFMVCYGFVCCLFYVVVLYVLHLCLYKLANYPKWLLSLTLY